MATTLELSTHRRWEDWLSVGVSILIVISPAVAGGADSEFAVLNAFVVGLALASIAGLELTVLQRWEEWVELLLGLWLAAAPWVLGYSNLSSLTAMHVALGALVALLACVELWQDRRGIPPVRQLS